MQNLVSSTQAELAKGIKDESLEWIKNFDFARSHYVKFKCFGEIKFFGGDYFVFVF